MESNEIRARSLKVAARGGVSIPPTLPLLDANMCARSQPEIVDRLLCLHAVAAVSYGFDGAKAFEWLHQEHLDAQLTDPERRFLQRDDGDPKSYQIQVEGIWALAWTLKLVSQLDFWKECDNRFVASLPNLKVAESADAVRQRSCLRSHDDLISACDLSYCLHWAVRQAELVGNPRPGGLNPYDLVERRRALEWVLSSESWDAVSLDT